LSLLRKRRAAREMNEEVVEVGVGNQPALQPARA
jgi:hypothetical protein